MTIKIKSIAEDGVYIFLNSFIRHVPCWQIRKIFYKLFGLKIGHGSRIGIRTIINKRWNIKIGNNSIINEQCHLDGRGGLDIRNNVSISIYTIIITGSHDKNSESFAYRPRRVIIHDNVWIGTRGIILDKSELGIASIVSSGSTLKGNTDKYGIYSGNPAIKVGERKLSGLYEIHYSPFFR